MTAPIDVADSERLSQAGRLLDQLARTSPRVGVCLHAATAATLIGATSRATNHGISSGDERTDLHRVLQLLGRLSESALQRDDLADALHQTLLAYLATR